MEYIMKKASDDYKSYPVFFVAIFSKKVKDSKLVLYTVHLLQCYDIFISALIAKKGGMTVNEKEKTEFE